MKKLRILSLLIVFQIISYSFAQKNDAIIEKTVNNDCAKIDSIVQFALSKVGCDYRYGAAGPELFDCSGLMYYTFSNFGIKLLRSSSEQYTMGIKVAENELRRGDLVFFKRGKGVGHVGIVLDVDSMNRFRFVHATTNRRGVCLDYSDQMGYVTTYMGARRLLQCDELVNELISVQRSPKENAVIQQDTININQKTKDDINTHESKIKEKYYFVKQGDTLYAISKKHKVSVDDIMKWNKLKTNKLSIGQKLKILIK